MLGPGTSGYRWEGAESQKEQGQYNHDDLWLGGECGLSNWFRENGSTSPGPQPAPGVVLYSCKQCFHHHRLRGLQWFWRVHLKQDLPQLGMGGVQHGQYPASIPQRKVAGQGLPQACLNFSLEALFYVLSQGQELGMLCS